MNKRGFTLLELIIVIVILGVLTALALPRMFSMVTKVKATEAIKLIDPISKGFRACMEFANSSASCDPDPNWAIIGLDDPFNDPGVHFNGTVAWQGPDRDNYAFQIILTEKANAANEVFYVYDNDTSFGVLPPNSSCDAAAAAWRGTAFWGAGAFSSLDICTTF